MTWLTPFLLLLLHCIQSIFFSLFLLLYHLLCTQTWICTCIPYSFFIVAVCGWRIRRNTYIIPIHTVLLLGGCSPLCQIEWILFYECAFQSDVTMLQKCILLLWHKCHCKNTLRYIKFIYFCELGRFRILLLRSNIAEVCYYFCVGEKISSEKILLWQPVIESKVHFHFWWSSCTLLLLIFIPSLDHLHSITMYQVCFAVYLTGTLIVFFFKTFCKNLQVNVVQSLPVCTFFCISFFLIFLGNLCLLVRFLLHKNISF